MCPSRATTTVLLALSGLGASCPGNHQDYRLVEGIQEVVGDDGVTLCKGGLTWNLMTRDTYRDSNPWRAADGVGRASVRCASEVMAGHVDLAALDRESPRAVTDHARRVVGEIALVERRGHRQDDGALSSDYLRRYRVRFFQGPARAELVVALEAAGVRQVPGYCNESGCTPDYETPLLPDDGE